MKQIKTLLLFWLFALCWVSFCSAFNTQLYYPNDLSNAEYCTWKMSLSLFSSNTNWYYLTDYLSSTDYCNSIVWNDHTFINDILVCARLLKPDRNQSSTATLVGNFVSNIRWNAWFDIDWNWVSVNNYPCLFFKSWSTPEFWFTTTLNLNNISWFNLWYSIYTLDNLNTLFNVSECPDQYSSLECQTEYNLIPVSSVDSNYCENNNLCSSSWSWDCWTWSTNWSALFINDIQHLGKPVISIDIPEEINRDYTSTDSEFNVEIIGYNVDYEKMNQTLSIQKYNPTSEDFTQVVWILAPY